MAPLTLTSTYTSNETSVSNIFLDTYMPSANGEFVKVYLYLLRMFSDPKHAPATLADVADTLNHTEGDVIRALKYWEKMGLLKVGYTADYPTNITLLPIENNAAYDNVYASTADVYPVAGKPDITGNTTTAVKISVPKPSTPTKETSPETKEELRQILFVAEQLLGKTLTTTDTNTILYIYNELNFSEELLEYLLEYCVSNEKRSLRYIEKVAISWHEEGITTVNAAKNHHEIHSKNIYSIMKAFGLDDRKPGKSELDFISKWYDHYGFEREVIIEACNRTIQALHKPSFEYTDTILANWKKNNVHTVSDLEAVDANKPKKFYINTDSQQNIKTVSAKPVNNRFNNFSQRTYDFTAIEKKLVGKKDK